MVRLGCGGQCCDGVANDGYVDVKVLEAEDTPGNHVLLTQNLLDPLHNPHQPRSKNVISSFLGNVIGTREMSIAPFQLPG